MTEQKKPQAGEFWLTRGGELRYVAAVLPESLAPYWRIITVDQNGYTESHSIDGSVLRDCEHKFDLIEYLPWCTSFNDPESVAEVWPKYFEAYDEWNAFVRCERNGSNFAVRKDGTREVLVMMDYQYFSGRKQLTESEALTRLQPPTHTCPDCSEPLTDGHADVCPMAWVVQDRVPRRPHVDEYTWLSQHEIQKGVSINGGYWNKTAHFSSRMETHGWINASGNTLHVRCRRKDLPQLSVETCAACDQPAEPGTAGCRECNEYAADIARPSTPDPGEGFAWVDCGDDLRSGDQWKDQQGTWHDVNNVGETVVCSHWYRRRITPPCTCPEPGVVSLDCPVDGLPDLGHGFSESDTVPVRFIRSVLTGCVYALLPGETVNGNEQEITIDRLGNASVRKAVQE